MPRMLTRLLLLLLLCLPGAVQAKALRVRLLDVPEPAVQALRQQGGDIDWLSAQSSTPADMALCWQTDRYQDIVRQYPAEPVLLVTQNPREGLRSQDAQLVWGAPLARQVQLAWRLLPGLQRIGIFHRHLGEPEQDAIRRAAAPALISFQSVSSALTARDIAVLADTVDILIASNDEQLFNRDSAKLVLLTGYRHQRAWIGPTPAFVHAGAVATWAVSRASLLRALQERIELVRRGGHLGGTTTYLPADELIGNAQVARSLGITLPPEVSHD